MSAVLRAVREAPLSLDAGRGLIPMQVRAMRLEAADVLSIELATGGRCWTGDAHASAGAHIDVQVPGVGLRQYSLLPAGDADHVRIGVQRDPCSRGGSRWVHDSLRPGHTVHVSLPRNHFPLDAGSGPACLIAGGIGVTPLLAMAHALLRSARDWRLHYSVRSRDRVAFAALLRPLGERVRLHVDDEAGGVLALDPLVRDAAADTHFYCCGPQPMLDAFALATAGVDPERVHIEHFNAPTAIIPLAQGSFEVELAHSGARFTVSPDQTILGVLLAHGVSVAHSCCNGVCGSCETAVLAGEPEHHDMVLSPQERASGKTMMLCVSRACSQHLLLDL